MGWFLTALTSIWAFVGTMILSRQFADDLPSRIAAGLRSLGWSNDDWFWFTAATILPLFLTYYSIGTLIFWLRPNDRMAVFSSFFMITFGAANSFSPVKEYLTVIAEAPPTFLVPYSLCGILAFGSLPLFFATFPDGRLYPRWMRWIVIGGLIYSVVWILYPDMVGNFSGTLGAISFLAQLTMFLGSLLAQLIRYRNYATPVQKQQTKFFLYMLILIVAFLFILPALYLSIVSNGTVSQDNGVLFDMSISLSNLAFVLLPIAIATSVMRYRLWDIDLIIRRTLQYALLTGMLALIYFGGVVLLQGLIGPISGDEVSPLVTVITTLGIATVFIPLRRQVQAFIDRRFYRSKFDAEKTLAGFAATARNEVDQDALARSLLAVVDETIRPEQVSLWLGK